MFNIVLINPSKIITFDVNSFGVQYDANSIYISLSALLIGVAVTLTTNKSNADKGEDQ